MIQSERVGLENLWGKGVVDDPRLLEIEKEIKSLIEKYDEMLVIVAIEQGVVIPEIKKEII